MSSRSKLLTPQTPILPPDLSFSNADTVSNSGSLPRQCSKYRSIRSVPRRRRRALARGDGGALIGVGGQHLADQEHTVAAALDRLADQLLRRTVAVHLGGVDQAHAQLDAQAHASVS